MNGLNQILTAGQLGIGYDGRGNLISSGASTYAYNADNLLVSAGSATLGYDPLGRLAQTVGHGFIHIVSIRLWMRHAPIGQRLLSLQAEGIRVPPVN